MKLGDKLGAWEIISASMHRAVARCRCGRVMAISLENLPASCGCATTARDRRRALRAGGRYRARQQEEAT